MKGLQCTVYEMLNELLSKVRGGLYGMDDNFDEGTFTEDLMDLSDSIPYEEPD